MSMRRPITPAEFAGELVAKMLRSNGVDSVLLSGVFVVTEHGSSEAWLQNEVAPRLRSEGARVIFLGLRRDGDGSECRPIGSMIKEVGDVRLEQEDYKYAAILVENVDYAMTHPKGMSLLKAIKAARDRVNIHPDGQKRLLVIGCGSDAKVLREMADASHQPFFGASLFFLP